MTYTVSAAIPKGDSFYLAFAHFTTRVDALAHAIALVRDSEDTPLMVEVEDHDGKPLFMWDPNGDYLVEPDYTDAQWDVAA